MPRVISGGVTSYTPADYDEVNDLQFENPLYNEVKFDDQSTEEKIDLGRNRQV